MNIALDEATGGVVRGLQNNVVPARRAPTRGFLGCSTTTGPRDSQSIFLRGMPLGGLLV